MRQDDACPRFVPAGSPNYFDLEDPLSLARLDEPLTALGPLSGLVVIDEVQRRPDLFPVLRVLADRDENPARSWCWAAPGPICSARARSHWPGASSTWNSPDSRWPNSAPRGCRILWLRGGFPRSLLAASDEDSLAWRKSYVQTFVERDLPRFGAELGASTLHRLLLLLAHYHGQVANLRALATALGIGEFTVRRYLDLMEHLFLVRQLRPWHENLKKRQV